MPKWWHVPVRPSDPYCDADCESWPCAAEQLRLAALRALALLNSALESDGAEIAVAAIFVTELLKDALGEEADRG